MASTFSSEHPSGLLLDSSSLQRSNLQEESSRLAWITGLLIAFTHIGCAILSAYYGSAQGIIHHSSFSALSLVFAYVIYRRPESNRAILIGAMTILVGMCLFLFVFPGPLAVFVYILAPIPAFQILGYRLGLAMSFGVLGIAALCLFFSDSAAEIFARSVRVNIFIAFLVATGFGWMFGKSREKANAALENALKRLRVLHGLIPICSVCKKVKEGENSWQQLESILSVEGQAEFTHGWCEECAGAALQELGGE